VRSRTARVMTTLMRNGRDRRSENPFWAIARLERVVVFGTDQRITSGPAATVAASRWRQAFTRKQAAYMAAPERFAKRQIPLAPRAPSIHGPLIELGIWSLSADSHFSTQSLAQPFWCPHHSSAMRVASARVAPMNTLSITAVSFRRPTPDKRTHGQYSVVSQSQWHPAPRP
jgi:hypothetical protein